jgi:hypothetical protein
MIETSVDIGCIYSGSSSGSSSDSTISESELIVITPILLEK